MVEFVERREFGCRVYGSIVRELKPRYFSFVKYLFNSQEVGRQRRVSLDPH